MANYFLCLFDKIPFLPKSRLLCEQISGINSQVDPT